MKRNIVFIYCNILLGVGTVFANNCDTMQCINTILKVVNNTIPVEISPIEWSGEWYLDEWQQIEYMPQEEIYQTSHIIDHVALVETSPNGQGIIEIEGYSISLDDCNHSVINISNQQVDNPYGSQDGVYGSKLVLLDGKLYVHLRIIGTQDFAVDIYGVGTKQNNEQAQASTWYGFRYYHAYPYEEYTPLITNLTYNMVSDTVIDGKQYRQILYTHEYENIANAYRGAIRQSENRQQVYYVPWGSNKEYLLYDFDVKQGDTVYAYAGFYDKSCEEIAELDPDRTITPGWLVMNVQTIDGRKHILVQNDESGTAIEWIEGVGTQHILWPQGRTCYATGMELQFQHTLCAADSEGNILYSYDTDYLGIRNNCPDWTPINSALENISSSLSATKIFREGKLLILRGNRTYTVTGQEVQ